jgi:hypothetical protein
MAALLGRVAGAFLTREHVAVSRAAIKGRDVMMWSAGLSPPDHQLPRKCVSPEPAAKASGIRPQCVA